MKKIQVGIFLALATLWGDVAAQAKDWFTVVGGTTSFELVRSADGRLSSRVPLLPVPDAVVPAGQQLVAQNVDVSNKLGRASALLSSVRATLEPETSSQGASLVFSADVVPELLPGPYGVVVRIGLEPTVKGQMVQQVSLTLTVPAPELRAKALAVDIVRPLPFFGAQSIVTPPVELQERTGKAPVRDIKVDVLRDAAPPPGADSGVLSFKPEFTSLVPSGAASAAVVVSGDYPLGKTVGKLEFRSPDLLAPVSVAYEVRVIESKAWIPILAFLGVLLGYGVRHVLKGRQEYKAAIASASEFVAALARARAASLDDDFRSELKSIRDELDIATAGKRKAAVVVAALGVAQPKLMTARTALDARLSGVLQKVQELRNFADVSWRAPGSIQPALDEIRAQVFLLEQDMLARNAKGANSRVQSATVKGLPSIVNAAGRYGTALAQLTTRLADSRLPLPEASQRRLVDTASLLTKSFPSPWTDVSQATVAQASQQLTKVYGDVNLALEVTKSIFGDSQAFAEWARKQLQVPETNAAFRSLAAETAKSLDTKFLLDEIEKTPFGLGAIDQRVEDLRAAWAQFCKAVVPSLTSEEVQGFIGSGSWQKLVVLAVEKKANAGAGIMLDAAAERKVFVQGEPIYSPISVPFSAPQWNSSTVRAGTAGLDGSEMEVYRNNKESEMFALAQMLVVALIFILGVYLFYGEVWVGKPKEMLTLFLLAFGLDLTADSVVAALKR
ncbi:MAG: hypothetical protein Q7U73_12780 [Rubrivivax sp.]|nr:hypothetical protein [Rubrivivax sp.]